MAQPTKCVICGRAKENTQAGVRYWTCDRPVCHQTFMALPQPLRKYIQSLAEVEGQRDEAVNLVEWIKGKLELQECNPTVLAYFNPYYWIDKYEWDAKVEAGKETGERNHT